MRFRKPLIAFVCLAISAGALVAARFQQPVNSASGMVAAANAFLATLTPEEKQAASFAFDDAERLNWHFIPRERKGLTLKNLNSTARAAAEDFIASGLSESGFSQALNIMSLEECLYLLEGGEREYRRDRRDPNNYFVSVFGSPGNSGDWGWRVEGHHLSLNYTLENGTVVSTTPEFFGANPGSIDSGPERQIRVLGTEEDLGRQILHACNDEQKKTAWISKTAPKDLRGGGVAQPVLTEAVGLKFSQMSNDQKRLLRELLNEYLKNMPSDVEQVRRAELNDGGMDNISFAWWGGPDLNQPHYYVVQGPSFIVEYNNVQNSANHVHSMWRDTSGDFNVPLN